MTSKYEFDLRLDITTSNNIPIEDKLDGIVAHLTSELPNLQRHLQEKRDLKFVHINNVYLKDSKISFCFQVNDENELKEFYEAVKKPGKSKQNHLSRCLTDYSHDQHWEICLGFKSASTLIFNCFMPQKTYHGGMLALSKDDEEDSDDNHGDEQGTEVATDDTKLEQRRVPGSNAEGSISLPSTDTVLPTIDRKEIKSTEEASSNKEEASSATPIVTNNERNQANADDKEKQIKCTADNSGINQVPTVEKDFLIRHPKGKITPEWILICFKSQENEKFRLNWKYDNIYGVTLHVPANYDRTSYYYEVFYRYKEHFYYINKNEEKLFSNDKCVTEGRIVRDVWNQNDVEGAKGHLFHLISLCCFTDDTHTISLQIENLLQTFNHRDHLQTLAIYLGSITREMVGPKASLVFSVAVAKVYSMLKNHSLALPKELCTKKITLKYIEVLQTITIQHFPPVCRSYMTTFFYEFSELTMGDNYYPLGHLAMCYDFLCDDMQLVQSYAQKFISNKVPLVNDVSSSTLKTVSSMCMKLYISHFKSKNDCSQQLLEMILGHVPLELAIDLYGHLLKEVDLTEEENNLQSVMHACVVTQIKKVLSSAKGSAELQSIKDLWTVVKRIKKDETKQSFKNEFEQAVLEILGLVSVTKPEKKSSFIKLLCENDSFFGEEKSSMDLVLTISGSTNLSVLNLLIDLADVKQIHDAIGRASANCLKGWFVNLIKSLRSESGEFLLVDLFKKYCQLFHVKSMVSRDDVKQIVEHELLTVLEKLQMKEILLKVKQIEELSQSQPSLLEVWNKLVCTVIQKKYNLLKPEDILLYLCGTEKHLRVNSRITADMVCFLMDLYFRQQQPESKTDFFLEILPCWKFWVIVLKMEGKEANTRSIKDKQIYQDVVKSIQHVINSISKSEVTLDVIVKLQKNVEGTKGLLACKGLSEAETDKKLKQIDTKYEMEKSRLACVLKVLGVLKGRANLPKLDILDQAVMQIKNDLGTLKFTGKQMQTSKGIWGKLVQLPKLCENIESVVGSQVFWNVSEKYTVEVYSKCVCKIKSDVEEDIRFLFGECLFPVEHAGNDDQITVCETSEEGLKLLIAISDDGVSQFREFWMKMCHCEEVDVNLVAGNLDGVDAVAEIKLAEVYCKFTLETERKEALVRISKRKHQAKIINTVKNLLKVVNMYGRIEKEVLQLLESSNEILMGTLKGLTFSKVNTSLKSLFEVTQDLSEDTILIMDTLSKSSNFIKFLESTIKEDFTNLIDAVEDISEQQVDVSTVSSLIEIQRYMHPVLLYILSGESKTSDFLLAIENQTKAQGKNAKNLPPKIQDCAVNVHNLSTLNKSVANRGEKTKEVISSIVKQGQFHFHIDLSVDQVVLEISYTPKGQKKIPKEDVTKAKRHAKQESALNDLRSNALLLMNSDKSSIHSNINKEELQSFVDTFDVCCSIRDTLQELHSSGHIKYVTINETQDGKNLEEFKKSILFEYQQWTAELQHERSQHYLLHFVRGFEIQTLIKYLETGIDTSEIQVLCKYIHPLLQPKHLQCAFYANDKSELSMLARLGIALHIAHEKENLGLFERPAGNLQPIRPTDIVRPGNLLIAKLKEDSQCVIQTVLTLYLTTTRCLPEASQIMFCSQTTKWSDIQLLIERCLGSYTFYGKMSLYCLADVEMLPNALQFRLVSALQMLPESGMFLFAIVCRGTKNHPFIAELKQYVASIYCLSDQQIKEIISATFPGVCSYVSEIAGLGKTTEVYKMGSSINPPTIIQTLHISDPFKKETVVKRLLHLPLESDSLLHIDIYTSCKNNDLDVFLFELIVLRFATIDKSTVYLENNYVALEISNTMNDVLRNSLQSLLFFNKKILKWENFENFIISNEVNSPVQVVCHHFKLLEEGKFDFEELHFSGKNKVIPLPVTLCRYLLKQYVDTSNNLSFSVVHTFLSVLADQLKKFSNSIFFKPSHIRQMVEYSTVPTVRSTLLKEMKDVSLDFAFRSICACRNVQTSTIESLSNDVSEETHLNKTDMLNRAQAMIRWEESNHLIFVFHEQNPQTLTPLYRLKNNVPKHIRSLFEDQIKRPLDDFGKLEQKDLQEILEKITKKRQCMKEESKEVQKVSQNSAFVNDLSYALTPDNLLKMTLIKMRIKSRVPVIVMGETGCGKTSLIRYLAGVCGVTFEVLNIHAGLHEDIIRNKVQTLNNKCKKDLEKERWLFLDEINTSESLGFICDILCHHRCYGELLSPNLVVMAACNPYKLRSENEILTAGLDGKMKIDDLSKLVYRVLPLPESMVDFVWDFGSLSQADEQKYIRRMLHGIFETQNHFDMYCDLVNESQLFIRGMKSSSVVSLRDVHRCKILMKWFQNVYLKYRNKSNTYHCNEDIVGMILSLAHCYHSRFPEKEVRRKYRQSIAKIFALHQVNSMSEETILQIIKEEQKWIIDTMEVPVGTARNSPLQENIFLLLICILNKIPIFIVGKPGCSKSLAIQIIRSNLRGKDSRHSFLQSLQQLLCVSFQGSESSTSEGIIKVFEKAEAYQNVNIEGDVLSVVLIDEIGLAEVSRFNPLKVLHSLLEPEGKSLPNVAVVGISNWALDASKMNRAIHLSRPDMDTDELLETGISICQSFMVVERSEEGSCLTTNDIKQDLCNIAHAYANYSSNLRFRNFHGLRDYYALVKYIASQFSETSVTIYSTEKSPIIRRGLERNFGGLPDERKLLYDSFAIALGEKSEKFTPVIDLIKENITDPVARHLMIITKGDSIFSYVERKLKTCHWEQINGSHFSEDMTDDYNYRILSRIILCMEQGVVLVLKNLESIYGSLYDMLNQNYTVVNQRKTCRVALGAYSNPYCEVANTFRCIVIVDSTEVDYTDPPFLNRFEKQFLSYADIQSSQQKNIVKELEKWANDISSIEANDFDKYDVFPNYNSELIPSLVLRTFEDLEESTHSTSLLNVCKQKLFWIMKPEAVVRLCRCQDKVIRETSNRQVDDYFKLPIHDGIKNLFKYQKEKMNLKGKKCFKRTIIFTNSNIHTIATKNVSENKTQCEKVGSFKSEKQLSTQIEQFCEDPELEVLCIQCNSSDDKKHILLTKSVLEHFLTVFEHRDLATSKYVYLIIHLDKDCSSSFSLTQINYLSEWKLVMMDCLEIPDFSLPTMFSKTFLETILLRCPLHEFIKRELFWAFSRIKYGFQGRNYNGIVRIMQEMQSTQILDTFERRILLELNKIYEDADIDQGWPVNIACDKKTLITSSSFIEALNNYVRTAIKVPLAKIVFKLEVIGALDCLCLNDDLRTQRIEVWKKLFLDRNFIILDDIEDESGPECYVCETPNFELELPFSRVLFAKIEDTRDEFVNAYINEKVDPKKLDEQEELKEEVFIDLLLQQESTILRQLSNTPLHEFSGLILLYIKDFCNQASYNACLSFDKSERIEYLQWALLQKTTFTQCPPLQFLSQIHCVYWQHSALFSSIMHLLETCKDVFRGDVKLLLNKLPKKVKNSTPDLKPTRSIIQENLLTKYSETGQFKDSLRKMSRSEESICVTTKDVLTLGGTPKSHSFEDLSSNRITNKSFENSNFDECKKSVKKDIGQQNFSGENQKLQQAHYPEKPEGNLGAQLTSADEEDPFEKLVAIVCDQMLPTKAILKQLGGVEAWQKQTHILLTAAAEVSRMPRLLHALRFCDDLAAELILPLSLDEVYLEDVGNSIVQSGLTSEGVYENLREIIKSSLAQKEMKRSNQLLSNFLERCYDYEPRAAAYSLVFELTLDGTLSEIDIEQMKRPFFLIIENELSSDHTFGFELLTLNNGANKRAENNFFTDIDSFLVKMANLTQCGHQIILLFVDLFQQLMFCEESTEIDNDCNYLLNSGTIIHSCNFGLQYLLAVAYIKSRLTTELVNEYLCSPSLLHDFDVLLQEQRDSQTNNTIITFFFKLLGSNKLVSDIHKTCQQIEEKYTSFKSLQWTSNYDLDCIETNPLAVYVSGYVVQVSKLIVFDSESTMSKQMEDLLSLIKCRESAALLPYQFLVNKFYFPRYQRRLTETDSVLADYILEKISSQYDTESQEFFSCVVGNKKDFTCKELIPSESKTTQQFFLNSVLVTTYALTLCNNKKPSPKNLLGKCLLTPKEVANLFFPGVPEDEASVQTGCFSQNPKFSNASLDICVCGQRVAYSKTEALFKCPICGNVIKHAIDSANLEGDSKAGQMKVEPINQFSTIEEISAVTQNTINLLVKGCFYGSLALGFTKMDENEPCVNSTLVLSESRLLNDLSEHWVSLVHLLNFTDYQLGVYLHAVIFQLQDLLFNTHYSLTSLDDKINWESEVEKHMKGLIERKIELIAEHIRRCDAIYGYNGTLEQNIRESRTDPENIDSLFRMTATYSKRDFCTLLHNQTRAFPFVKLYLEYESRLKLPKHIYDIVQWHLATVTALGYSVRTDECSGLKVQEFERKIEDKDKQRLFNTRFEAFQNTWKNVVESRGVGNMPQLQLINRNSELSQCLIIDEKSIVFQVLRELVSIQNNFIDASLVLASECTNLRFLLKLKDSAAIKSMHVAEIRKNVLIGTDDLDLEEIFALNSQSWLKYGYGQHIIYDFNRIERELVNAFLVNKSYIEMESLPKIQFFDEFYKNFSSLLQDVRRNVKQIPLPQDLLIQLKQSNESSMPSELIQHTGLLLTLLKKMQCDPDERLVDFVQARKNILGKMFPVHYLQIAESRFCLCHTVSLHETLEELCAKNITDTLEKEFQQEIDQELVLIFESLPDSNYEFSVVILKTLKIFVYRCLSMRRADADQRLGKFLRDVSFWPESYIKDGVFQTSGETRVFDDVFPERLLVGQTRAVLYCLEESIERVQQKGKRLKDTKDDVSLVSNKPEQRRQAIRRHKRRT